jgi:predicted ATPase
MLTRLKVSGFKNLVDVDIRFGPFTCIAGANGAGKSNLFDAIQFLSALADLPLIEAALSVRDEGGKTTDVRSLFHRVGEHYDETMSFEAEMIIPRSGVDDLGQMAHATITYLRYSLTLAYRVGDSAQSLGSLEIQKEELVHINRGEARRRLAFAHKPAWRDSAIVGRRQEAAFISTKDTEQGRTIQLHQDGGSSGRPNPRRAASLPRTVLSASNAAESPTALLARREMQSWRLLQLEPSSLRKSDPFTAPARLGADGSHLAATLYRLARSANGQSEGRVYVELANRLSQLLDDVRTISLDRDDRRQLLTVQVTGRDGAIHPAHALSDGTLRFLALAVLEQDPEFQGVICLEEPENGIHPVRIPTMIALLQDIAVDVNEPVGDDNPLRQVIINTHSPLVVQEVPEDSLLYAHLQNTVQTGRRFERAVFSYLPDTWRQEAAQREGEKLHLIAKGDLLAYLGGVAHIAEATAKERKTSVQTTPQRVIDRPELKQLMFDFGGEPE